MRRAITILAISMIAWGCGGGTASPSVGGGGASTPPAGASTAASESAPPVAEASPTPNTGLCAAKTPGPAGLARWAAGSASFIGSASLADGGGLNDDLEPVPGLLAETDETIKEVQVGAVRYAGSVQKLLEG